MMRETGLAVRFSAANLHMSWSHHVCVNPSDPLIRATVQEVKTKVCITPAHHRAHRSTDRFGILSAATVFKEQTRTEHQGSGSRPLSPKHDTKEEKASNSVCGQQPQTKWRVVAKQGHEHEDSSSDQRGLGRDRLKDSRLQHFLTTKK